MQRSKDRRRRPNCRGFALQCVPIAPGKSGLPAVLGWWPFGVTLRFFLLCPVSRPVSGVEIVRLSEKMNGLQIRADESV
jgi:hypothetical protein